MATRESRLFPANKQIASVTVGAKLSTEPLTGSRAIQPNASIRAMVQTADPFARFEFRFPPATINFDGFAAEYSELPRPLMNPAVDVKASRSYRVSFEFLVAGQYQTGSVTVYDGVKTDVEQELKTLEQMANRPIPVRFENFDILLSGNSWYIAEMSFNAVRYNTEGKITACQVQMSLINFQQQTSRFISVPRISYKPKVKQSSNNGKDEGGQNPDVDIDNGVLDPATRGGISSFSENGALGAVYNHINTKSNAGTTRRYNAIPRNPVTGS